jgi:uncharacterized protein (DUF4415 family)
MKTTAERQKAWRQAKKKEGFEMVTIWLDPDIAQDLKRVTKGQRRHTERQRVINEALRRYLAG